MVTSRSLIVSLCAVTLACGGLPEPGELGSGAIRSLLNMPGTNAEALDVGFDPARDGLLLAALQSGVADYGRGAVGRPETEPPVLVLGRHNARLQAMWGTSAGADFAADAQPRVAADPQGNMLIALGGFTQALALAPGAPPLTAGFVAQLSLADGFVRWSTPLPAAGNPRPRAVVVEPDGATVVVASAVTSAGDGFTTVRLDRFATASGIASSSRPLAVTTGNASIDSLAADPDGNLIAGGGFDGTLTLGAVYTQVPGQHAGFVAKLGRDSGAALWSRQLRKRSGDDAIVVAPLASGDVAVAGVFAFADDPADSENPMGPALYLRLARLSGATGETVWTVRTNLPNTAALELADLADGTDDLYLLATFSGTLQLGDLNALSTADSSMAMVRFAESDGTPIWLRFSSATTARGRRIGFDASGDAIGVGTFASRDADGRALASIFVIRVVP